MFAGGPHGRGLHAVELRDRYVGAGLATVLGNTQVVFVGLFAWWVFRGASAGGDRAGGAARPGRRGARDRRRAPGRLRLRPAARRAVRDRQRHLVRRLPADLPAHGPQRDAPMGARCSTPRSAPPSSPWCWGCSPTRPSTCGPCGPPTVGCWRWRSVSQTLAWGAIVAVLPRLPALDTSVILLVQPVLTVVWGAWLFAERPSPWQWAGVASVLAGVAVVVRRRRARAGPPRPSAGARARSPARGACASPTAPAGGPSCRTLVACADHDDPSPLVLRRPGGRLRARGRRQPQQPGRPAARRSATDDRRCDRLRPQHVPVRARSAASRRASRARSDPARVDGSGARVTSEFELVDVVAPRGVDLAARGRVVRVARRPRRACSW